MASVFFNKKVLRDERLLALMEATGRGRAELVGVLALFWLATREGNVSHIAAQSVAQYMPLDGPASEAMGVHLVTAGYLAAEPDGERFVIVDNIKALATAERRRAVARKAGLASAATRSKKQRKKAKPKSKSDAKPVAKSAITVPAEPSPSVAAWQAYAQAYSQRWGAQPVSNALVRGQMAAIVRRIGARAVDVMPFYVAHNDAYYVLKHHPVGLALKDCEALVTQFETQRPVTSQDVRSAEKEYGYAKQLEDIRAGRI